MINTILVVRETRQGEKRVALIPEDAKQWVEQGYTVLVESNAGVNIGYTDENYRSVGAIILYIDEQAQSVLPRDLLILRVKRASREREHWEAKHFSENTYMMGFLDPLDNDDSHIKEWQRAGITAFSLDQLKLEADNPQNVLAAMSKIAGRLAFEDGLANYKLDLTPNVVVIGTGTAGVEAARRAKEKQFSVLMIGRSKRHREKLEQEGVEYVVIPETSADKTQADFIRPYLEKPCIVVSAARSVGGKAPILIDKKTIANMSKGSVIVDLVAEGGNVEGSPHDQTIVTENGVTIINVSAYPKKDPKLASTLYSSGISKLVSTFFSRDMNINDPLLAECYVTSLGKRNPGL